MKHGRKEQFSITIDTETADRFYEYQEKHDIMYKNMAMEQLLNKAFLYIEFMETNSANQFTLFLESFKQVRELCFQLAPKNKTLRKALKMHYDTLLDNFEDVKIRNDIN